MSIQVADNFEYKGTKPLDGRVKYATLALMKAASEATLYDGIIAYVDATDKYYKFLSSNTVDADTGKWREYSSGGGSSELAGLSDVNISNPSDEQILQYDATSQKWVNASVYIPPNGKLITPTDDIETWLHCGNIWNKSYTSLADVLADNITLLALISSNNAVDYMVRSTTWVSMVTANSTAMTDIGINNYCADTLLADSTWRIAICNSSYYENVLTTKVPTMTSNSTPSGVASASSEYAGVLDAYKAFDGIDTEGSRWATQPDLSPPDWLQYDFEKEVLVCKYSIKYTGAYVASVSYELQCSNDGTLWSVLDSSDLINRLINITTPIKARYFRIVISAEQLANGTTRLGHIQNLQFYGRA